jgi:hypothetical protein
LEEMKRLVIGCAGRKLLTRSAREGEVQMGKTLLIGVALLAAGCSGRVETDDRPRFRIDPAQPFRLEFGRGSGLYGLETIRINQDGGVVLNRMKTSGPGGSWETGTLKLRPDELAEVLRAVDANGLMGMHRGYYADVHDGTQWVFWVQQGEREKSIYFDNNFPWQITTFAEQLDGILARAGFDKIIWQPVLAAEFRPHDRELWKSIKR